MSTKTTIATRVASSYQGSGVICCYWFIQSDQIINDFPASGSSQWCATAVVCPLSLALDSFFRDLQIWSLNKDLCVEGGKKENHGPNPKIS